MAFWSGHLHPEGLPRRVAGREAIRRVLVPLGERARAAGHHLLGLRSMVVHDTADPEVIIAEFEVQGEVRPSGQPYQLSYVQVLRVRDGEIVTFRDYWNPQALSSLLAHAKAVAGSTLVQSLFMNFDRHRRTLRGSQGVGSPQDEALPVSGHRPVSPFAGRPRGRGSQSALFWAGSRTARRNGEAHQPTLPIRLVRRRITRQPDGDRAHRPVERLGVRVARDRQDGRAALPRRRDGVEPEPLAATGADQVRLHHQVMQVDFWGIVAQDGEAGDARCFVEDETRPLVEILRAGPEPLRGPRP